MTKTLSQLKIVALVLLAFAAVYFIASRTYSVDPAQMAVQNPREPNSLKPSLVKLEPAQLKPENLTEILKSAKVSPVYKNGAVQGFQLTRIKAGSYFDKAGFKEGDIIEAVNGKPVSESSNSIYMFQSLSSARTTTTNNVQVMRLPKQPK